MVKLCLKSIKIMIHIIWKMISIGGLDVILGPMSGGKTSDLFRRIELERTRGINRRERPTVFFNSSADTRTGTPFSSKNPLLTDTKLLYDSFKIASLYQMTWPDKPEKWNTELNQIDITRQIIGIDGFNLCI